MSYRPCTMEPGTWAILSRPVREGVRAGRVPAGGLGLEEGLEIDQHRVLAGGDQVLYRLDLGFVVAVEFPGEGT